MIELTELTKIYERGETRHAALNGVSFSVSAGEIAAVIGPSGAGKSTLARCINMLERPTSGRVAVDGEDLTALRERHLREARRSIGRSAHCGNWPRISRNGATEGCRSEE